MERGRSGRLNDYRLKGGSLRARLKVAPRVPSLVPSGSRSRARSARQLGLDLARGTKQGYGPIEAPAGSLWRFPAIFLNYLVNLSGGRRGARTRDLRVANAALSQLS